MEKRSRVPAIYRFLRFLCWTSAICLPIIRYFPISGEMAAARLGPGRKYTTLERLKPERLRAVREDRLRLQNSRRKIPPIMGYDDYRAVIHAHAGDSSHTGGTLPELLAAAKQTGVTIVMLGDHPRPLRDFIAESWRGLHDGVLFIPGAESEGFIIHPTRSIIKAYIDKSWKTRDEFISLVKQDGGNIFLSHVEERPDWDTSQLDGMEIYNHHADYKDEFGFVTWLRGSFTNPDRLHEVEELLKEFPMEFFGSLQDYLSLYIEKWDSDLQKHRLTGIAANDCHHNQVFIIKAAAPDAIELNIIGERPRKITAKQNPRVAEMVKDRKEGDVIAKLDLDPYERSLTYVSTHILLRDFNEQAVRQALRAGHAYVAHDWLCDATGFTFIAELKGKRRGVMGDDVKFERDLRLRLEAPATGTIKLYRNGKVIRESKSDSLEFEVSEGGVYRAEVWLEIDGEQRPWIYGNPIRVL
ncbi:MAG: histidinol phosphatase [Blastocatellia bacterium]|nr:histidinol phosphatase [Blastocatellia bacterium]